MTYLFFIAAFFSLVALPWWLFVFTLLVLAFVAPAGALAVGILSDIVTYAPDASYYGVPWGVVFGVVFFFIGRVARRFFAARLLLA